MAKSLITGAVIVVMRRRTAAANMKKVPTWWTGVVLAICECWNLSGQGTHSYMSRAFPQLKMTLVTCGMRLCSILTPHFSTAFLPVRLWSQNLACADILGKAKVKPAHQICLSRSYGLHFPSQLRQQLRVGFLGDHHRTERHCDIIVSDM
jgi:hypothetical protein